MNILLLLAHSIEEYDQLKLLSGLGYDVFSIGGYIDPAHPHDPKRPALPLVPYHPDLHKAVDDLGTDDNLKAAKEHIPDAILDWADVIICHHYEHTWLVPQWERIRHKRVIWRTVGQSVEHNERLMAPLRKDGLEIVRYSPKERNIPGYAGEDALIRFYKDPDEYGGWTGQVNAVINITQHLAQRHPYTNYEFWEQATRGLDAMPLGPGSEAIGGRGELSYDDMHWWLRRARCYLYTGTQPASYTLGLIEAMMTGIPVVSIGPSWMKIFPYGPDLFEGHELGWKWADDPSIARELLEVYLRNHEAAQFDSTIIRQRAIDTFGKDTIAAQWKAYLGAP
jgi:glycosyltransferase involved in cell wall biosynthesis